MVDCAIIGGGLAGLATAILLAEQGYSVLVFEKNKYPFHKVCGEYVAMESYSFLQELGLDLDKLNLPRLNHLRISSPYGYTLKQTLRPGGVGISRFTLDCLLAQRAKELKVKIFENTSVRNVEGQAGDFQVKAGRNSFNTRTVIGSFGKHSKLDLTLKRLHRRRQNKSHAHYIGVKYHLKANFPNDRIELHNFKDGYCGISNVEDERTCFCYLTTVNNLKACSGKIDLLETRYLAQNPYLYRYLRDFPKIYARPLSISNISFKNKTLVDNDIFMVGDAAGLITPLCGNGMSMALHAAAIIGGILPAYLAAKINFKTCKDHYEHIWRYTFSRRLQIGRWIQSLFGNRFLTDAVIKLLSKSNTITQALINLTHGSSFSKLQYRSRTF